jgi:hypothetical protein
MLRSTTKRFASVAASAVFNSAAFATHQTKQACKLADATTRYHGLKSQKAELDAAAAKYPDRHAWGIFAYLVAQNAVLFQWTFYQFDWNLVEPITYLLGYSVTWLCTLVYFAFGKEFTYDALRDHLTARRRDALYAANDFDVARFRTLEARQSRLSAARLRNVE